MTQGQATTAPSGTGTSARTRVPVVDQVVVGVNGSGHDMSAESDAALGYGARLAKRCGVALHIVNAFPPLVDWVGWGAWPVAPAKIAEAEQVDEAEHQKLVDLAAKHAHTLAPDVHVERTLVLDDPGRALCEATPAGSLLVIGREDSRFDSWWHSSVGRWVLHHTKAPVTIVPADANLDPAPDVPIVVAIDGSDAARLAMRTAWRMAEQQGRTLRIVHVWDYPYVGLRTPVVSAASLMRDDAEALVAHEIEQLRMELGDAVAIDPLVVRGTVASAIVDASVDGAEVVMGARGRGGMRSLLLGSVSQSVAGRATVPITIVR
jgi:nucleotide-binding universal stress UspA family protein